MLLNKSLSFTTVYSGLYIPQLLVLLFSILSQLPNLVNFSDFLSTFQEFILYNELFQKSLL